ncbi:Protein YqjC [compost metagenome]
MTPRHLLPTLLLASCAALALPALAAPASGCAAKREHLQGQIEKARAQGNRDRQAGLETALSQVEAHCDDATLRQSREEKVLKAQHEVSIREADLRKAMDKGDQAKIDKRKTKLAEAREELRAAQEELQR